MPPPRLEVKWMDPTSVRSVRNVCYVLPLPLVSRSPVNAFVMRVFSVSRRVSKLGARSRAASSAGTQTPRALAFDIIPRGSTSLYVKFVFEGDQWHS